MIRPTRWGTLQHEGRTWWIVTAEPAFAPDGEIVGDDLIVIAEQTATQEPCVRALRWPATAACGPRSEGAANVGRRILAWCDTTRRPKPVVSTIHWAACCLLDERAA